MRVSLHIRHLGLGKKTQNTCNCQQHGKIRKNSEMATSINVLAEEPEPGTLPPPGRVKEVRKEWAVREDGAFAMQLQEEEIEQHYLGNISRRRTVRKDLVVAKDVQHEEDRVVQEALMKRIEEQRRLEELDRAVASSMQEALEREQERKVFQKEADELWLASELDAQRRQEIEDEELAKKLQDRERRRLERISAKRREKAMEAEKYHQDAAAARDAGASAENLEADLQLMKVGSPRRAVELPPEGYLDDFVENNADPGLNDDSWVPPEEREEGEGQAQADDVVVPRPYEADEAFARFLQEQEKQNVNVSRKDRAAAATAQDEEIARYLQDRERQLFVKGIRERAKIKHSKSDHSHLQNKLQQDYKRQPSAPASNVVRGSSGSLHRAGDSAAGGSVIGAAGGATGGSGTGSHDRRADSRGSSLGRNGTINTEVKPVGGLYVDLGRQSHDLRHRPRTVHAVSRVLSSWSSKFGSGSGTSKTEAVRDVAPDSQPLQDVADARSRGNSSSSSSPRGTTSNDSTPNFENINIASLIDPTCRDRPPEHLTSEQQGGQHWVSVKKVNLPPTGASVATRQVSASTASLQARGGSRGSQKKPGLFSL
ncbi:trichohyalin-like isoform X3 [Branchiostoma floridae]|uniref:Trichohyalin-like isoform X3 n=1 Tax=Branchiostoma floridae TaxID=7739 RepID=A0A9J7MAE6_BRAFL|nr:trichohyalin-like isoform X3 [Branchiostoma floridae]XP_035697259.1 trichohyalin-like isoform X3 [Branchiostoma floridae]XP_035697260.1 trichohyalin-like isoform X3 [Branchiostoma floridae]